MSRIRVSKPRGFQLSAARHFYAEFAPGGGMAAADPDRLTFAFSLDGTFEPVVVALDEDDDDLILEMAGDGHVRAVHDQLARMLGWEADADAWLELGMSDSTVGRLQAEFPGFFTAAQASPYDAATWAVLAPRVPMRRAAQWKVELARALGDPLMLDNQVHHVFPSPGVLSSLESFPGIPDEKVARLRAVGRAALSGWLDAERLREMDAEQALAGLQNIRGIGPWAAAHVYHRGAAPIDSLPQVEPRVLHGLAHLLGETAVDRDRFLEASEAWRPFRMWVCVLLARHLARTAGWHAPQLASERVEAARDLARRRRGLRPGEGSVSQRLASL